MLSLAFLTLAGVSSAEWANNNKTASSLLETLAAPTPGSKVRYMVFANPHSGAKELYDFLNEHSEIRGFKNLFTFAEANQTWNFFADKMDTFFKCSCPYVMDPVTKSCLPYANWHDCQNKVGFLWMGGQGLSNHVAELQTYLHDNFVRVITLTRDNCLAKLAEIEMGRLGSESVNIDKNRATYFCKNDKIADAELAEIASKSHHTLALTYEDMAYDSLRSAALEKVQDFMGANRKPMVSALEQQRLGSYNMMPLERIISNYKDLAEQLKGTDLEKYLGGKVARPHA